MRKEEYIHYYKIENDYWWFKGMRSIYLRSLKKAYNGKGGLRILDVGCGTGRTMKDLGQLGDVTGVDIEPLALEFCKSRGVNKVTLSDGKRLPFKDRLFDLVTLFNIIEHVDQEDELMKEASRVCADNGKIIVTTSAFNSLWSKHDIANEHKRRYTKRTLRDVVEKRFRVERMTYTNCLLFPLIWAGIMISNLLNKDTREPSDGFYDIPKYANKALTAILRMEAILLQKINFLFGVSLLCIAQKNHKSD